MSSSATLPVTSGSPQEPHLGPSPSRRIGMRFACPQVSQTSFKESDMSAFHSHSI